MAAAKKKSFKEEMEELLAFKAAPASLDPEGWGSEGARLDSSDDELYEEGRKGREVSRMRGVIDMGDDAAYVGRRASREAFFRAEQGKGRGDGGDERRNDTDTDTDTDGDGDGDDEGDGLEDTKDQGVYSGGEGEEDDDDDEEDEEDEDGRDNRDNRDDEDDELSVLEREMLEAERAEAQAVEEMKDRQAKELEKAKAVKAQKKLWQSGLEARIMMQKVMHGANKLPLPDVYRGLGDVDSILAQEMAGVAADARRTLGDLCDVLDAVVEVNPSIATAKSKSKSKRVREDDGLEACWAALDGRYAAFGVFRDSSLDRWHRKTMIESGGVGSSSASNMRVLNQGISKQVALLMKDVDRMAERSQMRTGEFQGLCRVGGETDTNGQTMSSPHGPHAHVPHTTHRPATNRQDDDDDDDARDPVPSSTPAHHAATVPETYVDTDFYAALLNEFLDANTTVAASKLHKAPKQRKIVDRRASKGRKLRYQIHEKLVNFMAPVDEARAGYTAQIFANLFGHKRM